LIPNLLNAYYTALADDISQLLNDCGCEATKQSNCPEELHAKNRRTEFVITRLQ